MKAKRIVVMSGSAVWWLRGSMYLVPPGEEAVSPGHSCNGSPHSWRSAMQGAHPTGSPDWIDVVIIIVINNIIL